MMKFQTDNVPGYFLSCTCLHNVFSKLIVYVIINSFCCENVTTKFNPSGLPLKSNGFLTLAAIVDGGRGAEQ